MTARYFRVPLEQIAYVRGSRGKNLHDIEFADGTTSLAELTPRFRNIIWIKRGMYALE